MGYCPYECITCGRYYDNGSILDNFCISCLKEFNTFRAFQRICAIINKDNVDKMEELLKPLLEMPVYKICECYYEKNECKRANVNTCIYIDVLTPDLIELLRLRFDESTLDKFTIFFKANHVYVETVWDNE
jgi:hypothetical protein